jgi:hypothetical protein
MDELTPYQLLLRVRLSARYHQQRRRVLQRRARILAYVNTALALGVVTTVLHDSHLGWLQITLSFGVALLTLADTLLGWNAQAFDHLSLYRRWLETEQWMMGVDLNDEAARREAMQRIVAIEADEPPENRAAVDSCDNELLRAEGHAPAHKIGWWGRSAASV